MCLVLTLQDTKARISVRKYYTLTRMDNGIKSQTLVLNGFLWSGMIFALLSRADALGVGFLGQLMKFGF